MEPEGLVHTTLKVVSKPRRGWRVLAPRDPRGGRLIFRGSQTHLCFDCGSCGTTLAVGVSRLQLENVLLRCAGCGSLNEWGRRALTLA